MVHLVKATCTLHLISALYYTARKESNVPKLIRIAKSLLSQREQKDYRTAGPKFYWNNKKKTEGFFRGPLGVHWEKKVKEAQQTLDNTLNKMIEEALFHTYFFLNCSCMFLIPISFSNWHFKFYNVFDL